MAERLANLGYCMIKKESAKGTPVIPTIGMPLISESVSFNPNLDEIKIIAGNKAARFRNLMGQRYTAGEATFLAEPNTAGYLADMILTKGSTTGSGTYTHPFTLSATTDPNSYTVEVMKGQIPYRYFGVESSSLGMSFDGNHGIFTTQLHARGVFAAAEITNVNSDTLTLATTYSSTPTKGLVATDVVRIHLANGSVVNTTVSSLDDTTVTVASASGAASGDFLSLRALTASLSLSDTITWARTDYRYSYTDASTALSGSGTPLEADSGAWTITHAFETDDAKTAQAHGIAPSQLARLATSRLPPSNSSMVLHPIGILI